MSIQRITKPGTRLTSPVPGMQGKSMKFDLTSRDREGAVFSLG